MDYYSILNLCREPFSNSPDPDYFFKSRQHFSCLQKVELALRLRRGLNVIIGEVGTGKTTLCRQLLLRLSGDDQMENHLILDPSFDSAVEFLTRVAQMIIGSAPPAGSDQWQLKESIKHHLFRKGIEEEKIVSLIIDEGQKIPPFCVEILREFLNYETNEFKLLQIVLFAQKEFVELLVEHSNFSDRVNFFTTLAPLNFRDTRLLIEYRLKQSSDTATAPALFSLPAYWAIYRISKGHPRKIIHLCHQSMLAMIIQNRRKISRSLVKSCARRAIPNTAKYFSIRQSLVVAMIAATIIGVVGVVFYQRPSHPLGNIQRASVHGVSRHPIPFLPGNEADKSTPPAASTPEEMLPFILGALKLNHGENLIGLIKLVHGRPSSEYIEALLTLNPHINDPDAVSIGTEIQFPAQAVPLTSVERNVYRIELGNFTQLTQARDAVSSLSMPPANIRMVAYWNPDGGLRFSVLLKELFSNANSAKDKFDTFGFAGNEAKIAADWTEATLFFSDPYYSRQ